MTSVTFQYGENETPGVTLDVYGDHAATNLIHSFANVQPGDFITVESSMIGLDRFGPKIYFTTGQNTCLTTVHTSCYVNIMGTTFLGFTVVSYMDYRGNHCYQAAALGNRVFEDLNGNGIQDAGEVGVDGVTVVLTDKDGVPEDVTTTSGGGFYEFVDLAPGNYLLSFPTLPDGYIKTIANVGTNDDMDSDVDKTSTTTDVISLQPSQVDHSWDLGILTETNFPVEFLGIEVEIQGNAALLSWATGMELNNDRFEIERAVGNHAFVHIATIQGAGTTEEVRQYAYVDTGILLVEEDWVYYRIRQVDLDGRYDYSSIVELQLPAQDVGIPFTAYPNPATDWLQVDTKNGGELVLLNASGAVLSRSVLDHQEGRQQIQFSLSSFPAGVYFLRLTNESGIHTKQIMRR